MEENDNYYVLEEDKKEEDFDNSPLNYAAYSQEDIEENIAEGTAVEKKSPLSLLFKVMFNPVEGWKEVRRSSITVENLQGGCFYPILALLALSQFAEFFYSVNVSLSNVVSQAVVSFVAFFLGYFSVMMVLSRILPKDMAEKFNKKFGQEYITIALTTLALFSIFTNLLPMIWPILIFLPIWTLYIMFKGIRFFKFETKQETKFYIYSGAAVIGVPLLIDWALNSVLPY